MERAARRARVRHRVLHGRGHPRLGHPYRGAATGDPGQAGQPRLHNRPPALRPPAAQGRELRTAGPADGPVRPPEPVHPGPGVDDDRPDRVLGHVLGPAGGVLPGGLQVERLGAVHPRLRATRHPADHGAGLHRGRHRPHPAGPPHHLPAQPVLGLRPARGRGGPDGGAGRAAAVWGRDPGAVRKDQLDRRPAGDLGALGALVRRGGGEPHVVPRARLLPLAAARPVVGHRRRGRPRRRRPLRRPPSRAATPTPTCASAPATSACAGSPPSSASPSTPTRRRTTPSPSPATSSTPPTTGWRPPASG